MFFFNDDPSSETRIFNDCYIARIEDRIDTTISEGQRTFVNALCVAYGIQFLCSIEAVNVNLTYISAFVDGLYTNSRTAWESVRSASSHVAFLRNPWFCASDPGAAKEAVATPNHGAQIGIPPRAGVDAQGRERSESHRPGAVPEGCHVRTWAPESEKLASQQSLLAR